MQQQTAEMILIPWRKPFFVVFAVDSSENRPERLTKTFLFWSAEMVVARWNLVRTECGPLVQKVANLWPKTYCFGIDIRLLFLISIARTIDGRRKARNRKLTRS